MPSFNLPQPVRFALYVIGLIGGLAVTLCVAEGWFDNPVAAFCTGVLSLISGLAGANTAPKQPARPTAVE